MAETEETYLAQLWDLRESLEQDGGDPSTLWKLTDKALAVHPGSVTLWLAKGHLLQLVEDESTELMDALDAYNRALELEPQSIEVNTDIGYFYDAVLDEPENAESYFHLAHSLGGGCETIFGYSRTLAQNQKKELALEVLQPHAPICKKWECRALLDEIEEGDYDYDA